MTHPAPHTSAIPPDAVVRFTAAEARLYPLAMVDPATYERAVTLTGTLLKDLRATCPDIDAVLDRREALMLLLTGTTDKARPSLIGFTPETLVDAASALRCRELQAELGAAAAEARVAAAREAGQEWLVDEPDPAAVDGRLLPPDRAACADRRRSRQLGRGRQHRRACGIQVAAHPCPERHRAVGGRADADLPGPGFLGPRDAATSG